MSRVKLTTRSIANFTGEPYKDSWLWDTQILGFGLKVSKAGHRTFVYKFRSNEGRQRKRKIGDANSMRMEDARIEALKLQTKHAMGEEIVRKRQSRPITVSEFCDIYMNDYAKLYKKPKSIEEDERTIRLSIRPRLGWIPLTELERKDIARLHQSLADKPYKANRVVALLSKMINLAQEWEILPDGKNPCRHIRKYKEVAKERYLSKEEIVRLNEALDECEINWPVSQSVIDAIRLLMMTGCRLGEILKLELSFVDLENARLNLPDSKTGKKTVWLGDNAISYIRNMSPKADNPYVVTGQRRGSHLVNIQKPWRFVRKIADLDDVRLHDLRHTYASLAVSQNLSLPIVGALLGHKSAKSTERYAHLYSDVIAEAAMKTARQMDSITSTDVAE